MEATSPDPDYEQKPSSIYANKTEHDKRIAEKLRRELGPQVCEWLVDPTVAEIMLNPDGSLWVEFLGGGMERMGTMPKAQAESLMGTVASSLRRNITAENPILECELPLDGSRFEAMVPPVVEGPTFTIRRKAVKVFTLDNYVESGIMTQAQCDVIKKAVCLRKNILVVGGTGTGKTTLTNAIIAYITEVHPHHRIIIIEDTRELQSNSPNVVPLRAVEHVTQNDLLKATMRLRPDRILVGECRDGSALALLKAWNTGHPGGVATIHSNVENGEDADGWITWDAANESIDNSATAGLIRMEQLVAEATQSPMQALIGEAVDLIVSIEKTATSRRINDVIAVRGYNGTKYITQSI